MSIISNQKSILLFSYTTKKFQILPVTVAFDTKRKAGEDIFINNNKARIVAIDELGNLQQLMKSMQCLPTNQTVVDDEKNETVEVYQQLTTSVQPDDTSQTSSASVNSSTDCGPRGGRRGGRGRGVRGRGAAAVKLKKKVKATFEDLIFHPNSEQKRTKVADLASGKKVGGKNHCNVEEKLPSNVRSSLLPSTSTTESVGGIQSSLRNQKHSENSSFAPTNPKTYSICSENNAIDSESPNCKKDNELRNITNLSASQINLDMSLLATEDIWNGEHSFSCCITDTTTPTPEYVPSAKLSPAKVGEKRSYMTNNNGGDFTDGNSDVMRSRSLSDAPKSSTVNENPRSNEPNCTEYEPIDSRGSANVADSSVNIVEILPPCLRPVTTEQFLHAHKMYMLVRNTYYSPENNLSDNELAKRRNLEQTENDQKKPEDKNNYQESQGKGEKKEEFSLPEEYFSPGPRRIEIAKSQGFYMDLGIHTIITQRHPPNINWEDYIREVLEEIYSENLIKYTARGRRGLAIDRRLINSFYVAINEKDKNEKSLNIKMKPIIETINSIIGGKRTYAAKKAKTDSDNIEEHSNSKKQRKGDNAIDNEGGDYAKIKKKKSDYAKIKKKKSDNSDIVDKGDDATEKDE